MIAKFDDIQINSNDIADPNIDLYIKEQERLSLQKASLYELNSIASKIFRLQLKLIKKKISDILVVKRASLENKSAQDYLESLIKSKNQKLTETELKNELAQLGLSEEDKNFLNIKKVFENKKKQQLIAEELDKLLFTKPIMTSLQPPTFEMSIKTDWTPNWGDSNSQSTLVAFTDFSTQSSQILIKSLISLSKKFPQIRFFWRPFFLNKDDEIQNLLAEASMCIWQKNHTSFFKFIQNLDHIHHDTAEKNIYYLVDNNKINLDDLKKCLVQHKFKSVVDYHLKYGAYLGLTTTPTLFLNGEAIEGEFRESVIEDYIKSYNSTH